MSAAAETASLRRTVYRELEPSAYRQGGLSLTNRVISVLIVASAALAVLETEPTLTRGHEAWFLGFEWLVTLVFAVEYAARVWVAVENPNYGGGRGARLRYALSPGALLDLVAILPVLLTFAGSEALLLRFFRLLRILRLARLGRFSHAMQEIVTALRSRQHELALSVGIGVLLLLASSTMLYIVEGPGQPEAFGSIPRAMWWSAVTLTTVGYGDVTPATPLGRIFAALTALFGIGLIAMPTGILAAAFSDVMKHRKHTDDA